MSKLLKTLSVGVVALAIVLGASEASAASYNFTSNLTVGSRGESVRQLQILLNSDASTQVATTGAGSPGQESTYFGVLTQNALAKFQAKHGITPAAGYFGAITRGFVATWTPGTTGTTVPGCTPGAMYSSTTGQACNGSNNPPVTTGSVSASLSSANTPSRSIVLGQASAELARYVFSGNGSVTNVTLQQIGLSAYNNTLQNVYLYSGATRLTDSGSVSSNGVITFNNPSGLFTVSGSREVTVRADLVSGTQNGNQTGTVGVQLTNFTANGTAAAAAISGNLMTVVNVTAAATAFTSAATSNPPASAQVNAGTSNYTVWSNQLSVSTRAVNLRAATFRYVGSAPATSLSNIKLLVDGAQVGTNGTLNPINGSNYVVFDLTSTPFVLTTGSHTLEVRADVVGGASYTFTVSIQNAADLLLEDSQLPGVYVTPMTSIGGTTSAIPTNTTANTVTILQGTNSVTVDPAFTTTTVTGGATNVPIAQYKFTGYGEDVKITSLSVTPTITGGTPNSSSLQNVSIYANGAQIGSTANYSGTGAMTFNLGSSLIIPSGQSVIVAVKSDIITSTSTNYTGGSIRVALAGIASNAEGQSSHQVFAIPGSSNTPSSITSNTLTIGGNNVTVSKNVSLTNQSVAPNSSNVKIGSFVIQAGSSEGFQVTNLQVGVVSVAGSTNVSTLTNLTNLHIVAGSNTVTPSSLNPQASNNFSANFTIPVSGTQVVDVYADLGASTGYASTTLTVTGRGTVSNVATTSSAFNGQDITLAQGGVQAAPSIVSSATLPAQYLIGPSSPTIATYNIVSTSSSATVDEVRFTITGSSTVASVAITANGVTRSAQVVAGVADITGLNLAVPQGFGGVNVVVTPTYATVSGTNAPLANSVSLVALTGIKSRSGNSTQFIGTTQSGGAGTISVTGEQTMILLTSKPSLSINTTQNSGLSSGLVEVGAITVSADVAGNITVNQLPVSLTTSGNVTLANQSTGAGTIVIKDGSGNTITTATSTLAAVGTNSTGTMLINFTGGYQVAAGTSQTFKVSVTAALNAGGSAGTQAVSTKVGAAASFIFTDVNGNASNLTGTPISNYPTGTHTITN